MPKTHLSLKHAKMSKHARIRHQGCFQAIYKKSLDQVFGCWTHPLGGRLNALGKVGRARMEFGCCFVLKTVVAF